VLQIVLNRVVIILYTYLVKYTFLPLGATAQSELWPPEQSASILLYSKAG
jgi:hypothetical protein